MVTSVLIRTYLGRVAFRWIPSPCGSLELKCSISYMCNLGKVSSTRLNQISGSLGKLDNASLSNLSD